MWLPVLSIFSDDHPQSSYLYEALADPLPNGFIAIALLDSANEAGRLGQLAHHPFDTENGRARLQRWLEDPNPERMSYANSATAALPFIREPQRSSLLALAMDHVDPRIQMEAAWAAGKLGREPGLKILARFCLDVIHSAAAIRYLGELGREDLVPTAATEPAFVAQAEFAAWLAHPNELDRPPDRIEIVDHRMLAWPPNPTPQPFWVLRFLARAKTELDDDQIDCGLVGSMTWCFFCYAMHQRPPEDVYAIHCFWELTHDDLIKEQDATDPTPFSHMWNDWQGDRNHRGQIKNIATLSPRLNYPRNRVALASAELGGETGWIVLDGPDSAWYPSSDQPRGTIGNAILEIHVGRRLLGLGDCSNRKRYLPSSQPQREPAQTVAAYEELLERAKGADPDLMVELIDGPLSLHFDRYVEALASISNSSVSQTLVEVYVRFVQIAKTTDEGTRSRLYGSLCLLSSSFSEVVDALVALGRKGEISGLIDRFATYWDHNSGYRSLGTAAFKSGQLNLAEAYFVKLLKGLPDYYRCDEMALLAQIWHDQGQAERARELLLDCMQKLLAAIRESKYNDTRRLCASVFQSHRAAYARLFPDTIVELSSLGLPADLLEPGVT